MGARRAAIAALCMIWAGLAQGADEQEVSWFTFDSLLVVPFQPTGPEPELAEDAAALSAMLQARLARSVAVVDIGEVPAFETHGYDARTYVASCPPGDYPGCALVVAQRVEADWAIGGTLSALEEDLLGIGEDRLLELTFLDVRARRELLAFGVVIDAVAPEEVLDQVVAVFDRIIAGAFELVDVRGSLDDPEVQAQLERSRAELVSESLEQLDAMLGGIERPAVQRQVQGPRLTRQALQEAHAGSDEVAPWVRAGMDEAEYVRFRNSGLPLDAWRDRRLGRAGQLILRGGFVGGAGPFGVRHEGVHLVVFDPQWQSFDTVSAAQLQEQARSGTAGVEGELAVGIHPAFDLGFAVSSRSGQVSYRFEQEIQGTPFNPGPHHGTAITTWQFGPRLTFTPFPARPVRPTVGVGLSWWQGRGVPPPHDAFERLEPPRAVFLGVAPGVEVRAGKFVDLFARGLWQQRIEGRWVDRREVGDEPLSEPPISSGAPGPGLGIVAGVQLRLRVVGNGNHDKRPIFEGDDL